MKMPFISERKFTTNFNQLKKSDLISRQAAINALGEEPEVWLDTDVEIAQRAQWRADRAAIEAVPTAEKKGESE